MRWRGVPRVCLHCRRQAAAYKELQQRFERHGKMQALAAEMTMQKELMVGRACHAALMFQPACPVCSAPLLFCPSCLPVCIAPHWLRCVGCDAGEGGPKEAQAF